MSISDQYYQKCMDIIDPTKLFRYIRFDKDFNMFAFFSQKSDHWFENQELINIWELVKKNCNLSFESAIYYARKTNPEKYRELIDKEKLYSEPNMLDDSDLNQCKLFYIDNPKQFVCCIQKYQTVWYQFTGHRFVIISDQTLKKIVVDYLINKYRLRIAEVESESDLLELNKIMISLNRTKKRNNIISVLSHFYMDDDFPKKQDQKQYLIGFNNGVLDLKSKKFRDGCFDDYITKSTGYDYIDNREYYDIVDQFYNQLFSHNDQIKSFMLNVLANTMIGNINRHFYILNGLGSNGKSTLLQLLSHTFGDYLTKIDSQLLKQSKQSTQYIDQLLDKLTGVRYVVADDYENIYNEPFKLSSTAIKMFFGFDHPMLSSIFLACNKIPIIDIDDLSITRRLKFCPFKATFEPNPKLDDNLHSWNLSHFHYLVDHLSGQIEYPKEILEFTQECMLSIDPLNNIINDLFVQTDNTKVGLTLKQFRCMVKNHTQSRKVKCNNDTSLIESIKQRCQNIIIVDDKKPAKYISAIDGSEKEVTNCVLILGLTLIHT